MNRLLLLSLCGLIAADSLPNGLLDPISRFTAVSILGGVVFWLLMRTIPRLLKDHKETLDAICERQEARERLEHEDRQELNATLRELRATCAATQAMQQVHVQKKG